MTENTTHITESPELLENPILALNCQETETEPIRVRVSDFLKRTLDQSPIQITDEFCLGDIFDYVRRASVPVLTDFAVQSPEVTGSTPLFLGNPQSRRLPSQAVRYLAGHDLFSAQLGSLHHQVLYELLAGSDIDIKPEEDVWELAQMIVQKINNRIYFPFWSPELVLEETGKRYRWICPRQEVLLRNIRSFHRDDLSSNALRPLWIEIVQGMIKTLPYFSFRLSLPLDRNDHQAAMLWPFWSIDAVQLAVSDQQKRDEARMGPGVDSWSQVTARLKDDSPGEWQGWRPPHHLYFELGSNFSQLSAPMEIGKEYSQGEAVALIEKTARTARVAVSFWDLPQRLIKPDSIIIDRKQPPITDTGIQQVKEAIERVDLNNQSISQTEAKMVIKEMMLALMINPYLALSVWQKLGILSHFPAFKNLTADDWLVIEERLPGINNQALGQTKEQEYWQAFQSFDPGQRSFKNGWEIFVETLRDFNCLPLELELSNLTSSEVLVKIFDIRVTQDSQGSSIELQRPL